MPDPDDKQVIAVIGCGNLNRSDDGVGPEVLRALRSRDSLPGAQVRLLDAGTDGMGVMFSARGCSSLIVVDSCQSGSEPGTIFEVPGDELQVQHQPSLTLHDFRWDHALFAGHRMFGQDFPDDVTVFLIEAGTLDFGIGLSPVVAKAAERVTARIEALVHSRLQTAEHVP